jgi:hypothetical protein
MAEFRGEKPQADTQCLLCSRPGQFRLMDLKSQAIWLACAGHLTEVAKYASGQI